MNKPTVRIAVIGAGSYVFGPSVLHDAIVGQRLDGAEIALIDIQKELVENMAAIGQRMARESGVNLTVSAHTDRRKGLDGADFVICSAARDMHRRFAKDVALIRQWVPGHHVSEFGGIQGISYSFRQMALIEEIAKDMRELAPNAWLLDSANPLPRVCQYAQALGVKSAGFCANSMGGYYMIGKTMLGLNENYPWPQAQKRYEAIMAGMNHFTWLLKLVDRTTGQDVTKEFTAKLLAGSAIEPYTRHLIETTGYWGPNGDAHMRDFLPPMPFSTSLTETSHGTDEERSERWKKMVNTAAGREPWDWLVKNRSWEKPVDFAAGLILGRESRCHSLNLANNGQIPNLPRGSFVETPAWIRKSGPAPDVLPLPDAVLGLSRSAADVTNKIVEAFQQRSMALTHEAVTLDPTIVDKKAGVVAINECLKAHADILPAFR